MYLEDIMRYWFDCSESYGDVGSCVLGAGFQFKYNRKWYFMTAQSPWQGSISWEHYKDEIQSMLEDLGATDIRYH